MIKANKCSSPKIISLLAGAEAVTISGRKITLHLVIQRTIDVVYPVRLLLFVTLFAKTILSPCLRTQKHSVSHMEFRF